MFGVTCFLAVAVATVMGASAPFIQPCVLSDSACLLASSQAAVATFAAGIPELNVPTLDPVFLEYVSSNDKGLQLSMTNSTVVGMKDCNVDYIRFDTVKSKLHLHIRCSVNLDGWYKLGGRLLVLPIQGEGKYNIKIKDIVIKTLEDIQEVTGDDGKTHWHIGKWKHTFEVKTNAKLFFENLFGGNKVLAAPVAAFANNNWKDVIQETGPPIVAAIVGRVIDAVEALFKAVPLEELVKQN